MSDFRLVTVAVLCYEQRLELLDCICSILNQNYPKLEILICDDGSKDFPNTKLLHFLNRFLNRETSERKIRILHSIQNKGTVANCNLALKAARGEYIKFLAADDRFYSENTITQMVQIFNSPQTQVVCGRGRCFSNADPGVQDLYPTESEFKQLYNASPDELYKILCTRPWSSILAPAVMFRTDCVKKLDGFDLKFRYLEDWPFWIKLCKAGIPVTMTRQIFVWYRLGGISSVKQKSCRSVEVRTTYLKECQFLLKCEEKHLHNQKFLQLCCKLSRQSLELLEHTLVPQKLGLLNELLFWLTHFPSLFYKKMMGAIGNHKYFSASAFGLPATFICLGLLPTIPVLQAVFVSSGCAILLFLMISNFILFLISRVIQSDYKA